jgi:alpha-D-ribose 1-methylphosphonate 5-triphosphate synthase subunit PhnL
MILIKDVAKTFVMHLRDSQHLPVVRDVTLEVGVGECVVLAGPSGIGKSSILKMIYGNYRADVGRILVNACSGWVDVAAASPRQIIALRQSTLGYVSQYNPARQRARYRHCCRARG